MTEAAIPFDLWLKPSSAGAAPRIKDLLLAQSDGPKSERLKAYERWRRGEAPLLLATQQGWAAVQALRARLLHMGFDAQVYQAEYGPEDAKILKFCRLHALFFAGVLGCPVCTKAAVL